MTGLSNTPGGDPHVDLTDDASVQEAVRARRTRRDLSQVESDLATLTGTLRDLAERGVGVTLHTDDDRRLQGVLVAVARDHVVLAMPSRQRAHLPIDAVHLVRTEPGMRIGVARGDRTAAQDLLLQERITRWVPGTPRLAVFVTGRSDPLRGRLEAIGEDVVTLRGDSDNHPTWIAMDAVRCVVTDE